MGVNRASLPALKFAFTGAAVKHVFFGLAQSLDARTFHGDFTTQAYNFLEKKKKHTSTATATTTATGK